MAEIMDNHHPECITITHVGIVLTLSQFAITLLHVCRNPETDAMAFHIVPLPHQ